MRNVLNRIFNDSDSDISSISSDSEDEDTESYTGAPVDTVVDNSVPLPPPGEGIEVENMRQQVEQMRQRRRNADPPAPPAQPAPVIDDNNNDLGAEHNFVRDYYGFEAPYEPDWLPNYERRHAVLVDTSDFLVVDFFRLHFPQQAVELICNETNRYAEQYFDTPVDFFPNSRFLKWTNTSVEEISAMVVCR